MPSSNRGSHPYQRFIPREEVVDVAPWSFAPVGSGELPQPDAKANAGAEAVDAETLETLRQQAYAEGFENGRLAGVKETRDMMEAQMRRQTQEQAQKLAVLLQKVQGDLDRLEQGLAHQVLELACDLARQVVRRELDSPLEPLKAVTQEALALAVADGRPATLKLHPQDAEWLRPALAESLTAMNVTLAEDAHLTPGGCVVETAQGGVDARLEKRWARAVANLGLQEPWQPGDEADV